MENRRVPALIALAGVVIAVVVFFFVANDDTADQESETTEQAQTATPSEAKGEGQGDGKPQKPEKPERPAEPEVPEIQIEGGEPVGGVQEIEVTSGEDLRIDVRTDAADELHLHGFDLYFDVVPGKTNEIVVENADIEGVLELESHTSGALLAEIAVVPA
jgi:hypothetical protein